MPKVLPWDNPDYALCMSGNDGRLRYLIPTHAKGAWRVLSKEEISPALKRERERQDFYNDFLGSMDGKTVLVFATGPMMDRVTAKWARHIAERDDTYVIGINAAPAVCSKIWGYDPSKLFDMIVGADAVHPNVWEEWGWNLIPDVPKFCKKRTYSKNWIPVVSAAAPTLSASDLFYRDSVTAAISLALFGLATETYTKDCAGPRAEWPKRHLRRADGGQVILLGVEHNRYDHCYSDRKDFLLADLPDQGWGDISWKFKGHEMLQVAAQAVGATVFNAAHWSLVRGHPFLDVEAALDVPKKVQCGLTAKGEPGKRERALDPEDCCRYQKEMARWFQGGKKGKAPKKPKVAGQDYRRDIHINYDIHY